MAIVFLVGRVVFSLLFITSGIRHFQNRAQMAGYSRMKGAPAPDLMVPVTGAMLLVGGLLVAFGVWADLGALLIFLFLVPTALFMHAYWKEGDPAERAGQQAQFWKNISLAGAALVLLAVYAHGHLPYSITGPLF